MHFFSYQNDNRSSPRPKKSWHFRKRGQQRYKKKKVERRNASDLLNKMIKCDFNDDNYERIKKIGGDGGLIAIDNEGNIAMPFNTDGMYRASWSKNGTPLVAIY